MYSVIVVTIDVIRFVYGPLPVLLCDFNYICKLWLSNSTMTLFLFISIAKFMFIFVWKNIPVMEDSFIALFLAIWAWIFGMMLPLIKVYFPARPAFNQVKPESNSTLAFNNLSLGFLLWVLPRILEDDENQAKPTSCSDCQLHPNFNSCHFIDFHYFSQNQD